MSTKFTTSTLADKIPIITCLSVLLQIYCRPVAEFSDKSMSFDINTITHGPLKPSTINHCFTGLKKTSWYLIMLEAVTDSSKVYQDTPHLMATALLPVVNITKCEVIEMKERAALEEKLCSSVMQRER